MIQKIITTVARFFYDGFRTKSRSSTSRVIPIHKYERKQIKWKKIIWLLIWFGSPFSIIKARILHTPNARKANDIMKRKPTQVYKTKSYLWSSSLVFSLYYFTSWKVQITPHAKGKKIFSDIIVQNKTFWNWTSDHFASVLEIISWLSCLPHLKYLKAKYQVAVLYNM